MNRAKRFTGTAHYVSARWPRYLLAYGGAILALLAMGIALQMGWLSLIPLILALFLLLLFWVLASLWAAHRLYDRNGLLPHHVLFEMAQLESEDDFVLIDLGLRYQALDLVQWLTTGHLMVIDIYHPQLFPNGAVARGRTQSKLPPPDPRLSWRSSQLNLLPLPDASVSVVIACEIISELAQHGDRLMLLHEIYRVLTPNGRLLLAERTQTRRNWLTMGPDFFQLPTAVYWRTALIDCGFQIRGEKNLAGLIDCLRVDKPIPTAGYQLALNLPL